VFGSLDIAVHMITSHPKFCRGFLCGSLLGCTLLVIGLLGWSVAILVGVEQDRAFAGFSLTPLYVLSFGLGGGVLGLLQREHPRWYEIAIAWAAGIVIVLLGCGAIALLLESGRAIERLWGASSAVVFCALLVVSLFQMRKKIGGRDS
jgi:hypothetical protein